MTPTDVTTYVRQQYNAVNDTFFSDAELYTMIWDAQNQLAREAMCIKRVYTTTTVVGQQEYQKPTASFSVKRITYNGRKLVKVSDREDDALTLYNQTTTTTGSPLAYWEWDTALELRPIPDDTLTLKIYSYDLPQIVTSVTTLDVPTRYHLDLANCVLEKMCGKDKNYQAAAFYGTKWAKNLEDAKKYEKKTVRGDAFSHVLDENALPTLYIGVF